jgi:4-amino-4-deoxy-L-arabinose transferase-like glycosyltransferase
MSSLAFKAHIHNLTILSVVCGLVFFLFLGKVPFHDKGEPREALLVQDIVDNGNWLFPLKLGHYLPSKPPLFHWIGAIAAKFWGTMTETTVRFPSALFATLGILLIYYLGNELYGAETGFFAALMLATTIAYQNAAVEARVDMTLVFFLSLSLTLFFALYLRHLRGDLWWYAFFIVISTGILAKGPVSLILSGMIIFFFIAATKQWAFLWELLRHPGVIVASAIFTAWYGAALWQAGSEFAALQIVKENLARFFVHGEGGTGHQKPIYYFLLYLLPQGFPWTIFLPVVLWSYFKDRRFRDERALFFGIWIAVVLLFFSLSAGKRPPYILPLYVPLALLTAHWCCAPAGERQVRFKGLQWIGWFAAGIGLTLFVLLLCHLKGATIAGLMSLLNISLTPKAFAQLQLAQGILDERKWLVRFFLFVSALVWLHLSRDLMREKTREAAVQIAILAVFTVLVVQGIVVPVLASARSYQDFVQLAKRRAGHEEPLLLFPKGLDSSAIVFYGGSKIQLLSGDVDALRRRLEVSRDYVILGEHQWKSPRAGLSSFQPVLRSRGKGADGDDPLVLIQGNS